MKVRFPLYAKILLWFFLNLVVVGIVFYGFFKAQFRWGLDSLLTGPAGERIEAMSLLVAADLNEAPRTSWDEVLQRFENAYHIKLYLFRGEGGQLAGEQIQLPPEVSRFLNDRMRPGMPRPFSDGQNRPQRRPDQPDDHGEPSPDAQKAGPTPPNMPGPKMMVHTSDPSRYWVCVRLRLNEQGHGGFHPSVLVAASETLSGGGLFFDFKPWIVVGLAVLVISALFWLPLARGLTLSISQMTKATEHIASGRFDTRVTQNRNDELGRLAEAINSMGGRLAGFVTGQKRFLGDIAHELCSPIARIQLSLGILEQNADAKQKAQLEDLREEVQHMSSLVNELLSFSKASLEPAAVKLQSVQLQTVVEQVIRREGNESVKIIAEVANDLTVKADPELLIRSLANLVRNAIRYAGQSGPITIAGRRDPETITLTVTDNGPGVPEDSLAQLFDPFYRPEKSRDRTTGGVGLGLAIVKTCIESCGGTVKCRNKKPSGFEVEIKLQKI